MTQANSLMERLKDRFPGLSESQFRGQRRWVCSRDHLPDIFEVLKSDPGFDSLVDITCVDYLNYRGAAHRFGLAYLLANSETGDAYHEWGPYRSRTASA